MRNVRNLLAASSLLLVSGLAHAEVVINELLHVSGGATDFVELYNNGGEPVDISGWTLHAATVPASINTVRATVPADTVLPAGGYWLFAKDYEEGDENAQALASALPAASSNADAVQIRDPEGNVIDMVLYGARLADSEDWGENQAQLRSPKPENGRSISRRPNGVDNDLGTDFVLTEVGQNTPGAANYEPPVSSSSSSTSGSSGTSSGSSGTSSGSSGTSSGSSGTSSGGSSSGNTASSSGTGEPSSSSGAASSSGSSSGRSSSSGRTGRSSSGDNDDEDEDNSALASNGGGCSSSGSAATPVPFAVALGALLVARRRNAKRRQTPRH